MEQNYSDFYSTKSLTVSHAGHPAAPIEISGPRPILQEVLRLVHWIGIAAEPASHHSWALRTQKEMIVSIKSGHAKKPWGKARDWYPTVPSFFLLKLFLHFSFKCWVSFPLTTAPLCQLYFDLAGPGRKLIWKYKSVWSHTCWIFSLFCSTLLWGKKSSWSFLFVVHWRAWLQPVEQLIKIHLGFTHEVYYGDCLVFRFILECFSASSSFYPETHQNSNRNTPEIKTAIFKLESEIIWMFVSMSGFSPFLRTPELWCAFEA